MVVRCPHCAAMQEVYFVGVHCCSNCAEEFEVHPVAAVGPHQAHFLPKRQRPPDEEEPVEPMEEAACWLDETQPLPPEEKPQPAVPAGDMNWLQDVKRPVRQPALLARTAKVTQPQATIILAAVIALVGLLIGAKVFNAVIFLGMAVLYVWAVLKAINWISGRR